MDIVTESIFCCQEELILTNQRALFWKAKQSLILSDLHIGKTAHFRKNGIPISSEILHKDLERLKTLIQYFKVETLMVVGDLFHAEFNDDVAIFKKWTLQFVNLQIVLIKGNHDRASFDMFEGINIKIFNNVMARSPFVFTHHIKHINDTAFYITGHTHPGVFLKGRGKQRIKLPSYQVGSQQIILPAFSLFTGLNTNLPPGNYINYAFTNSSIFKI